MIQYFFRKIRSIVVRANSYCLSSWRILIGRLGQDRVFFGSQCYIDHGVRIKCTDGGLIKIGDRVSLGRNVDIICKSGRIYIEDDVYIGPGCIIVCQGDIFIGSGSQIAEYCVIRDQEHAIGSGPIKCSGFVVSPISIGSDCWLGAKSTVLRGSSIEDGVIIGAHALVKGNISRYSVAVGAPARVVRVRDDLLI